MSSCFYISTQSETYAKPDFQILLFTVFTMDQNKELIDKYINELHISNQTPIFYFTLSNNDGGIPPKNGANYYLQCNLNGAFSSMNIYPTGDHGFGFHLSFPFHLWLLQEIKTWLQSF